jgi:hypothetical protein
MVAFEILVNGERRFSDDRVTAITLAADWVSRRNAERVSLHVGVGEPGERQVQHLGADLGPGDEITIRVLAERDHVLRDPELCSFCGSEVQSVKSLVAGPQVAICDACLAAFSAVVASGARLPIGASIHERGDIRCGFCRKAPPKVPGVLVRNGAAVCPECLRACADVTQAAED